MNSEKYLEEVRRAVYGECYTCGSHDTFIENGNLHCRDCCSSFVGEK